MRVYQALLSLSKHSKITPTIMLNSKFKGCLTGALLGDCLGSSFEGEEQVAKSVLQKYFDKLSGPAFKTPIKMYTDDTAMTKCIAESLVHHASFDEKDLARRFVTEYYQSPNRGYGANVPEVFAKLKRNNFEDIWRPAQDMFNGTGSYGNGGAMRVSPVALFCYSDYQKLVDLATKTTKITHTNKLGVNGALLQATAIYLALKADPKEPIKVDEFLTELRSKMEVFEKSSDDDVKAGRSYVRQLDLVKQFLSTDKFSSEHVEEVVKDLGHSVAALYSVPTAVYCFLKAQKPIPFIETENVFQRTIQYAISLGGDTDTIASMAGAICGAHLGIESISPALQAHCEFSNEMITLADELYRVSSVEP